MTLLTAAESLWTTYTSLKWVHWARRSDRCCQRLAVEGKAQGLVVEHGDEAVVGVHVQAALAVGLEVGVLELVLVDESVDVHDEEGEGRAGLLPHGRHQAA